MIEVPLIGISRLRFNIDGKGITTLVAFHGCQLNCKYCLNPQCLKGDAVKSYYSSQKVYEILRKDELYFLATNGGATFGGGEPLLKVDFIKEILELGAKRWHTTIETSLNVPLFNLEKLFPYINEYIVDIKDMNPTIYKAYTGFNNDNVLNNLKWLINKGKSENILCRIPLIPEYNTQESMYFSKARLEDIGIHRFEIFKYITDVSNKNKSVNNQQI